MAQLNTVIYFIEGGNDTVNNISPFRFHYSVAPWRSARNANVGSL